MPTAAKQNTNFDKRPAGRRRRQAGFTLLEMGIAIVLMAMIFIGTWTMYLSMAQTAMRTDSEVYASQSAANALQYMIMQTRESWDFLLPGETHTYGSSGGATSSFTGISGYAASSNYTYSNSTQTINTAVELLMPVVNSADTAFGGTSSASEYTLGPTSSYGSLYSIGGSAPGNALLFYRSDSNGTPDPSAGMYLWMYSLWDSGATYNKKLVELFDTQSAARNVPNAIQFDRPYEAGSNTTLPFELEIKIICGNYSPINGVQTNEATNGADATALTGKCVLMRDHLTVGYSISGGNSTSTVNNKFYPSGT